MASGFAFEVKGAIVDPSCKDDLKLLVSSTPAEKLSSNPLDFMKKEKMDFKKEEEKVKAESMSLLTFSGEGTFY